MNLAKSCKWLSFTKSKCPRPFKKIVTRAITVTADTIILAKIYQANKVLNQCGVIDINQSHAIIDSVARKKAKNNTEYLKFFL